MRPHRKQLGNRSVALPGLFPVYGLAAHAGMIESGPAHVTGQNGTKVVADNVSIVLASAPRVSPKAAERRPTFRTRWIAKGKLSRWCMGSLKPGMRVMFIGYPHILPRTPGNLLILDSVFLASDSGVADRFFFSEGVKDLPRESWLTGEGLGIEDMFDDADVFVVDGDDG